MAWPVRRSKRGFVCLPAVPPWESQGFWNGAHSETWKDYVSEQIRWGAVSCGSDRGEGRLGVQKRGCDGGSLGPGCAGELQLLGAGCFRCPLGNTLSLQTGFSAGRSANEWFSFREHGGKCHTRKITVSVLLCVCLWTMRISMERNYSGPALSSFSSLPFLCLVRLLPPSLPPLSKLGASVHLFAVRWTEQNLSPVLQTCPGSLSYSMVKRNQTPSLVLFLLPEGSPILSPSFPLDPSNLGSKEGVKQAKIILFLIHRIKLTWYRSPFCRIILRNGHSYILVTLEVSVM